eukprot:g2550.t1
MWNRDCAKATMVNRYVEVAGVWDLPLGSYDSLYEYLACSLDNYKTASSSVREVMLSPVCKMSEQEKAEMHANLKRLKQRGFVSREENSTPVTLVDIIRANESGSLTLPELVSLLLCFYCALRPKELCKLAVDYSSRIDEAIAVKWEDKDIILNFVKTAVKSNLYKCIRARCVCRELEEAGVDKMCCICFCKNKMRLFSKETDVYKIATRAMPEIPGIGGHSFRIGATVWLFRCGTDPLRILIHCRWQALNTLLGYLRSLPECAPYKFLAIGFAAA